MILTLTHFFNPEVVYRYIPKSPITTRCNDFHDTSGHVLWKFRECALSYIERKYATLEVHIRVLAVAFAKKTRKSIPLPA
ncbi:hypothetical protein DPMN_124428 [Dreissena polymorpha]|uniref:Uncharacterized protein n=1 Tax=Dreissena polymorpha TaxID=45954 RepID=A0A9D4GTE7_DREPO|nr:hypothetical protein DPMN_124428 [Dreissena polymorpha]